MTATHALNGLAASVWDRASKARIRITSASQKDAEVVVMSQEGPGLEGICLDHPEPLCAKCLSPVLRSQSRRLPIKWRGSGYRASWLLGRASPEQVRLSPLVGGIGTKIVLAESQLVGHTSACARSFRHRSSLATPNRQFHSRTNSLFKGNLCAREPTDARTPGERTTSEAKSRVAVKECRGKSSKDGLCDGVMLASTTCDA